jgi:hypothetical protein
MIEFDLCRGFDTIVSIKIFVSIDQNKPPVSPLCSIHKPTASLTLSEALVAKARWLM